jgi:signal transduction histidine kinase
MPGHQRVFILGFTLGAVLTLLGVYFLLTYTLWYTEVFGIIFGSMFLVMAVAVAFYFGRRMAGGADEVFDPAVAEGVKAADVRTFSSAAMAGSAFFVALGIYFLFFVYSPFAMIYFIMACLIFMFYYHLGKSVEPGEDENPA